MFTIMTAVMFFKQGWKAALPAAIIAVVFWLFGLFFFKWDFGGPR
jgi:hypothetical protein